LSNLRYFFARFDGPLAATAPILAALAVERTVENEEFSAHDGDSEMSVFVEKASEIEELSSRSALWREGSPAIIQAYLPPAWLFHQKT
jgi:hypothetical protein